MKKVINWLESPPLIVNNFHSSYIGLVYPEAQYLLHGGEIDVAIQSLSRPNVRKVIVAELNPTTATLGEWKKQAIRELSRVELGSFLFSLEWPYSHKESRWTYRPFPEFQESGRHINLKKVARRVSRNLPKHLRKEMDRRMDRILKSDYGSNNGPISNLHYLVPGAYEKIKQNIDKLEIVSGDVFSAISKLPDESQDIISLNNILDYTSTELIYPFTQCYEKLRKNGRLIIVTAEWPKKSKYSEFIPVYHCRDGSIRAGQRVPGFGGGMHNEPPEGADEMLKLSTLLREIGFRKKRDKIYSRYIFMEHGESPLDYVDKLPIIKPTAGMGIKRMDEWKKKRLLVTSPDYDRILYQLDKTPCYLLYRIGINPGNAFVEIYKK